MASHPQTVIELKAGSLAEADLSVSRVEGREALSHPFAFDVHFLPVSGNPIDLAALAGADALLTLKRPDGIERYVHGIVWSAELTGVAQGAPHYQARIAPKLARLAHVRRSRVFQSKSVPEIVKKVLDDAGVANRAKLSGRHEKREYCLQYRESDLDFVSRLLEDEGIFYWFEHASDSHTLVLADAGGGCVDLAGDTTVPFRVRQQGDAEEDEHVFRMARAHRVRPGKVTLKDYDFERPELQVTASAESAGDKLGLEHYEYPGGFSTPSVGSPIARMRLEEDRVPVDTFDGESTCLRFHPGARFELSGHPDAGFDRKVLLLSVSHEAAQQQAMGHGDQVQHGYRNAVLALDSGLPYRPRQATRRPTAYAETATVVGPAGEEIHVDAHGRVKVRFHWDREGAKDDTASCWVRLSQSWAGAAWGASFVPRIGQEVLVRFLEGDPDSPLVVGAVYNGAAPPPISLPGEKTKSTVRTDSSLGGGGSNELLYEDAKGAEEIYLHAQKDEKLVVEHDKAQVVTHDEALHVGKDRTQEVSGNQALRVGLDDATKVGADQSITVLGNRSTAVAVSHEEEVNGSQTITVARTETTTIGGASTMLVGAAAALNVGGAYAVNVGGALNVGVGGARLEQVGGLRAIAVGATSGLDVEKDASARAGGDDTTTVAERYTATDDKDRQENVGKKARLVVADQVVILAKEIDLSGNQKFTLNVGGKQILQAKSGGQILLAGDTVTMDASGNAIFKGSQVKKTAGSSAGSASASKEKIEQTKPASATASFSKTTVEPLHTDASGAPAGGCEVTADVKVTNVPDGKKGQLALHHCATGAMVKGTAVECKVQGGKLVDAKTGKPPAIKFDASKMPWDPWDKPFFYLVASVKHGGLKVETPRDVKDGGKSLRVKYWSVAAGDSWADTPAGGGLTTGAEAQEIAGILKKTPNSMADARILKSASPTFAQWGKHIANTYAYHHGSHGTAADRTTGAFIKTKPPPKGFGDPPETPVGNWHSVVALSYPAAGGGMNYLLLGDTDVANKTNFPSVPRYLVYLDCCLAGWEPSLGRAFVGRGTRYVIAFRRTIPDNDARTMARNFYNKWAGTHKLDPDKIRALFFETGTPFYKSMRPVLIGWKVEPILDPATGALEAALHAVAAAIEGVVTAIGSLFK
jgi:type VI secretion system secreted protein VgrG